MMNKASRLGIPKVTAKKRKLAEERGIDIDALHAALMAQHEKLTEKGDDYHDAVISLAGIYGELERVNPMAMMFGSESFKSIGTHAMSCLHLAAKANGWDSNELIADAKEFNELADRMMDPELNPLKKKGGQS
jgi:hypothetical protein